jgi:hypothetical protein
MWVFRENLFDSYLLFTGSMDAKPDNTKATPTQ